FLDWSAITTGLVAELTEVRAEADIERAALAVRIVRLEEALAA
ncbi:hypothetical protein LCGC14_2543100, partial [marine sediment metagenome]